MIRNVVIIIRDILAVAALGAESQIPTLARYRGVAGGPSSPAIVGGREAERGAWPWHGGIVNWYGDYRCGAVLIAADWALTAAHCVS